jgi:hypothetical protein
LKGAILPLVVAGVLLGAGCSSQQSETTTTATTTQSAPATNADASAANSPQVSKSTSTTTTTKTSDEPDSVVGSVAHAVGTIILFPFRLIGDALGLIF